MPVRVSVDLSGDVRFQAIAKGMRIRGAYLTPVLREIKSNWVDIIEAQFNSEGRRGLGEKWEKLKTVTVKKRGSAHPILDHHGNLRAAYTSASAFSVKDNEIEFNIPNRVDYGEYHETGTVSMPERPVFFFHERDLDDMVEMIADYIDS